ncbi:Hairy/enhancer-of-split with YRPW motif protein 2 [Paramarasmius palmivorus]|uniref:Sugar phosphate phosphatase n=1 Tax=Paramarasmius palmivorus TaxID=297713 RepID=A0AAW0CAT3_9AGAR
MVFTAPFPPYDPTDKSGSIWKPKLMMNDRRFSYETVVKRWPIILTSIVDQLHRENHNLHLTLTGEAPNPIIEKKVSEGKDIIEKVSKLKYEMARDHALVPIPQDGEPSVELYNSELDNLAKQSKNTWFTAPWLYAEYAPVATPRGGLLIPYLLDRCYLYRLLRSFFKQTEHWRDYDPFFSQKVDVFQKSGPSIYRIGTTMNELEAAKQSIESDPNNIAVFFQEMIQMCLWGNATDLSLLTHMTLSDIEKLQTVEKEAQSARKEFILKDDQDAVWDHVKQLKDGRVDFVLDNAGFEVFTDLVFADFLVTYTPHVSKVVFHGKLIPWFVSDVTPPDFKYTIASLLDPAYFAAASPTEEQRQHLKAMANRIARYVEEGVFAFSVPIDTPLGGSGSSTTGAEFWTNPLPYWDMETYAPELWKTLRDSDLVIFKGDLNYRKLTGDIKWPSTTSFKDATGPLAGTFPLLSLRTNKADVAVGLTSEVLDAIEKKDDKWRVNGKYALISYLPRNK